MLLLWAVRIKSKDVKIIRFFWDNAKSEEHNGRHLIIGQHLPKKENDEKTHIELYGVSLDIADQGKDYRLKELSCHVSNLHGDVKAISREDARAIMIKEMDEALDILYDPLEMQHVDEHLNREDDDEDEEE